MNTMNENKSLSISDAYLEQIVALTMQRRKAWLLALHVATVMDDDNVAYCTRAELAEKVSGREKEIPALVKCLCDYGFLYQLDKDLNGWTLVVNPSLMIRDEPEAGRAYKKWPAGIKISGPYMVTHDKWVENGMAHAAVSV